VELIDATFAHNAQSNLPERRPAAAAAATTAHRTTNFICAKPAEKNANAGRRMVAKAHTTAVGGSEPQAHHVPPRGTQSPFHDLATRHCPSNKSKTFVV
jgi:hypothetical protein